MRTIAEDCGGLRTVCESGDGPRSGRYALERRHRSNRALGGVGIVNGAARERVAIFERRRAEACGLALDRVRPIVAGAPLLSWIIHSRDGRRPVVGSHVCILPCAITRVLLARGQTV